jgi:hypothetical protein
VNGRTYDGYLETLAGLVATDRAQVAALGEARAALRDATEDRARVLRQTETLLAVVRRQLAQADLPDVTATTMTNHAPDGRSPSSALDAASRLAAQLSAHVDTLLADRAEAAAQAEREAAERERRKACIRLWTVAGIAVVIMILTVVGFGLLGGS